MKILFLSTLFILTTSFTKFKSPTGLLAREEIAGTWWNAEKDAQIRIFLAKNDKFSGKIEWMKEPNDAKGSPKIDDKNPNEKLRSNPRLGLVILKNFDLNTKSKRWEGGTVYDPKSGKLYDGHISFEGNERGKLNLRGYLMGMSWIGKTAVWEKVN